MTPVTFLLFSCLPLWVLAVWMWMKYYSTTGKSRLLWLASFLCIFLPQLFFPLCAYIEKVKSEENSGYSLLMQRVYRLRMSICACCFLSYFILSVSFKCMCFQWYGEIAVSCVNVFFFLLVFSCWNLFQEDVKD